MGVECVLTPKSSVSFDVAGRIGVVSRRNISGDLAVRTWVTRARVAARGLRLRALHTDCRSGSRGEEKLRDLTTYRLGSKMRAAALLPVLFAFGESLIVRSDR